MPHHPAWSHPETIRTRIAFARGSELPDIRIAAFKALDGLQSAHPAHQVQGLFLLATAFAQALVLDPHEMVSRAIRQLPDAEAAFTEQLQAARDYALGELKS